MVAITSPPWQARRLYNSSFLLSSYSKQNDCKENPPFSVGCLNVFPWLMAPMVIISPRSPLAVENVCVCWIRLFELYCCMALAELSTPFRHMFLISNEENKSKWTWLPGGVLRHFICYNDHSFKGSYSNSPKPWQHLIFQSKGTVS